MTAPKRLDDVRVIDLSLGLAGAYATKLFADAGADVIKVEPAGGDPLRRWSASGADIGDNDGALFRFLHGSKRSVIGSLGDPDLDELIAGADIVVESDEHGSAEASGLLARPGLVVLSITPWGRGGPLSGRPATEFIVQAESGSIGYRGHPDAPPVQAGGRIAEWASGAFAAAAALAGLRQVRATGVSVHIDVAQIEVMCLCTNLFLDLSWSLLGRPPIAGAIRSVELPSIEPAADGWVGFNTNTAQMFQDFLVLIDQPDLIGDPRFATFGARLANIEEWRRAVHAYTTTHTTDEIVELASLLRIPVAPVGNGKTVLAHEHLAARAVFQHFADGAAAPRPPYKIDGRRPALADGLSAPRLGEHTGVIEQRRRAPFVASRGAASLPFAGLRVLDITSWWAGPSCTQLLAALGADVIHLESIQKVDGIRLAASVGFLGRGRWWEYSGFFLSINPDKRDLTLDLADPDGLAAGKKLVEWADVIVENYTPRVLENFGLDWDAVHAINPRATMVRMPAYGLDGPWRDRPGFAQNMEQLSGLAWLTGYPDAAPLIPRGPCDPLGGMHAAFALQVALADAEETGVGVLVEVPLIEAALNIAAEQVLEYTAYGALLERSGNRSPGVAPQGVYACAGSEQWLAVSVVTDAQWRALRAALGDPEWARDPSLDALAGRIAAHDALDDGITAWATGHDLAEAVTVLVGAGVPAAAVVDPRAMCVHPHLVARGFFEQVDHPVVGSQPVGTLPFRWTGIDKWITLPAPTLGQHNAEILRDLAGLSDSDIDALSARNVIGESPLGISSGS